ncbi:FUSC family protein [Heyndrickxia sp. FSL W8-0423]|uniref:FUSC family protein n=1 Tax=Heyndrickxia sp. FSL W8-0423 TaxID=2921601 RepID=UPI0030F8D2F0
MKLGARIFKTGIAIILALYIAKFIGMPSPVFAGIAAIFAIKPTIYRSYLSILEQVQGNIIGAIVAVAFGLVFENNYIIVGLAALITIIIMLKLKLENSISLGLVTMIVILESPGEHFLQFAWIRFSTILIGILSAFVVNLIFLPPKYETKLYHRMSHLTEDIFKLIRLISMHASEHHLMKKEIEKIRERLVKVNLFYTLFNEERSYFKKSTIEKKRKTVIYRQMVSALQDSFDILKLLHRYEHELKLLPETIQIQIQERLDFLMNEHQKLLFQFLGKVSHNDLEEKKFEEQQEELLELFLDELKDKAFRSDQQSYHLMRFLSAMVDYHKQLTHLSILIESFQNYHKDANEVSIEEESEE